MKNYADVKKVSVRALQILKENRFYLQENRLFIKLAEEKLSFDQYFEQMKTLESNLNMRGSRISWETLKKENYEKYKHELAHYKVWEKYGVTAYLYQSKENKNTYYVLDENFREIAVRRGFGIREVKEIQKEAAFAPFKNSKEVKFSDFLDILQYEILEGNLKKITHNDIYNSFIKYSWIA